MPSPDKTVFISYRRTTSRHFARLIFMDLRAHNYDVFMDVDTIDSGTFDTIILNQIAARAHFILLVTAGSLDRCSEPNDWLRREIEYAIDLQRNIVPIFEEGFDPKGHEALMTGKLIELQRYNGLHIYQEYFDAGMDKLRNRFLKEPNYHINLTPAPVYEQKVVEQKINEIIWDKSDSSNTINFMIVDAKDELEATLYYNQAEANWDSGDYDKALIASSQAIKLNPRFVDAYICRAKAHFSKGHYDSAETNFTVAVDLVMNLGSDNKYISQIFRVYNYRGRVRYFKRDYEGALSDFNTAIELNPKYAATYNNRAVLLEDKEDLHGALRDYQMYVNLSGGQQYGNQLEIEKTIEDLQKKITGA